MSLLVPHDLLSGLGVEDGDLSGFVTCEDGLRERSEGGDGGFGADGVEFENGVGGLWIWREERCERERGWVRRGEADVRVG